MPVVVKACPSPNMNEREKLLFSKLLITSYPISVLILPA